jgi:hypothetical protein
MVGWYTIYMLRYTPIATLRSPAMNYYTVSIETEPGVSIRAPLLPEYNIDKAREIAALEFNLRKYHSRPILCIGIFLGSRLVDSFDGRWASEFQPETLITAGAACTTGEQ